MKHFLLLTIVFFAWAIDSQAEHCTTPVNGARFDQFIYNMQSLRGQQKLRRAIRFAQNNCLISDQVKTIAMLFKSDQKKLQFALEAFDNVFDKENFYDVYDAFSSFSMAFRLHDAVHGLVTDGIEEQYGSGGYEFETISFPTLDYPDPDGYNGLIGCMDPMDNQLFMDIAYRVIDTRGDDAKLDYLVSRSKVDCFTMAQAMKLATLFDSEIGSMAMLKVVFSNLFDMENYMKATSLFNNRYSKNDWIAFAETRLAQIQGSPAAEIVYEPSAEQMSEIKLSLSKRHFARDKLHLIRIVSQDFCFDVGQIRELMKAFTFSSDKLELAKITYVKCVDPHNYWQLIEMLTFPSEKRELSDFITERRGLDV